MDRDRIALRSHPENILLLSWGGGTASFGAAPRVPEFPPPPRSPPRGGGVRTNFRDLDPVWERERERVNRDALTRLRTPRGVGG